MWTEAYYLEFTSVWLPTYRGLGAFGVTYLISDGHVRLVVKLMERT